MNDNNNIFKLRFYENEVSPESFTIEELGALLISLGNGVRAIVEANYPEVEHDSARISLVSVKNESESLILATDSETTSKGFLDFARSIHDNTYTNLPKKAYDSYKSIHDIVQKKQCKAELVYKGETLYVVVPEDNVIKQENVLIDIDTVLYGILIKIGASSAETNKVKAWVELLEGKTIYFNISREDAYQFSDNKLFKTVALKGKVKWNVLTKSTVGFKFYELLNYKPGNVSNGFQRLRDITSGFWDTLGTDDDITNHFNGD